MGINLTSPTTFTSAVLIGDTHQTPGGSNDTPPSLTRVGGNPVSAAVEIQSTKGALLLPRMTTEQIDALETPVDGMLVYDSVLNTMKSRQGGVFGHTFSTKTVQISAAEFLGCRANPVLIAPSPGAGKAILVTQVILEFLYNSFAYSGGGDVFLQYGSDANPANTVKGAAGLIEPARLHITSKRIFGMASAIFVNPIGVNVSDMLDKGIYLTCLTSEFADGNSPMVVTILYTTIVPA